MKSQSMSARCPPHERFRRGLLTPLGLALLLALAQPVVDAQDHQPAAAPTGTEAHGAEPAPPEASEPAHGAGVHLEGEPKAAEEGATTPPSGEAKGGTELSLIHI